MSLIDLLLAVLHWLLLAFFGGQALIFIGLVLWMVWTDAIKPRLISMREIDRVAADIIADYPDPELEAFARHERAWYRSDGAEQTYWYRCGRPSGGDWSGAEDIHPRSFTVHRVCHDSTFTANRAMFMVRS